MTAVSSTSGAEVYEFDDFCLLPSERLLLREGQPVALPPKVFDVLVLLVESDGHLVDKNELLNKLWPETFVEEATLTRTISSLRKALGKAGRESKYIETVSKRGYRFIAAVSRVRQDETALATQSLIPASDGSPSGKPLIQAAVQPVVAAAERDQIVAKQKITWRTILLIAMGLVVMLAAALSLTWQWRARPAREIKSIAVLPFSQVGYDAHDAPLEFGMADTLITRLHNIKQLTVRPTSAIIKYQGQSPDPLAVGRELKVDAVLVGNIQKSGDRVRVNIQLVSVSDGTSLWAQQFDANFTDIFAVQDAIATQVVQSLNLQLSGSEQHILTKRGTNNSEAYQFYLKGRYWLNKRTPEGFRKAIDYFNQAITLDSSYALAYAGLVDSYTQQSSNALVPPREALPKARAAAAKALELDESLMEIHSSLGHLAWLSWDWARAEQEFQRVEQLDPAQVSPHLWYAIYLSSLGRHEAALAIVKQAQEQSPTSIPVNQCLERTYYFARQYDAAIATSLRTLELEPNSMGINSWLEMAYEQKGLYDEAVNMRLKALAQIGVNPEEIAELRAAYQTSSWHGYIQKQIAQKQSKPPQGYIMPYNMARLYARSGDKESALKWLEKAYDEHADHLVLLKVDPLFDLLRSDSRFQDLMRRVGFAGQ